MKLTESQLKQIIKEELRKSLNEYGTFYSDEDAPEGYGRVKKGNYYKVTNAVQDQYGRIGTTLVVVNEPVEEKLSNEYYMFKMGEAPSDPKQFHTFLQQIKPESFKGEAFDNFNVLVQNVGQSGDDMIVKIIDIIESGY